MNRQKGKKKQGPMNILFGNPEEFTLEHRFLNMVVLVAFLSFIFFAVANFVIGIDYFFNIFLLSMSFILMLLYYLSRIKRIYDLIIWILFTIILFTLSITWLYNAGSQGSTIFLFFMTAVFFVFLLDGVQRIIIAAAIILNVAFLLRIDIDKPEYIIDYPSPAHHFWDFIITFFLVLVIATFLLSYIKRVYERERKRAEESDKLKTAFLANLSHEIRTPLNGILGSVQLLKEYPDIQDRSEYMVVIQQSSEKLLQIINDILALSQIESGQLRISKDKVNVNSIFINLITYFSNRKAQLSKDAITLKIGKTIKDQSTTLITDPDRLKQVLTNLLDNALKFTNKGKIEFGCFVDDNEMLRFYVKDTGIGIKKEYGSFIFERFRQYDDSYTRDYGGAGLGLTISRSIVDLLGGRIWFEHNSDAQSGTVFYFTIPYLPVTDKKISITQKKKPGDSFPDWSKKRILIIESDSLGFLYLRKIIEKTRAEIIHAHTGAEGINAVNDNGKQIDLVLINVQLPKMNVYEAIEEIKHAKPDLPIIVQTSNALPGEKEKCIKYGCCDYIGKPFNVNAFFQMVERYL